MNRIRTVGIPGIPVAKARPRVTKTGRAYTPEKTRQWERMAAQAIRLGWGSTPMIDRAIMITVIAVYPRPKRKPRDVTADVWQEGGRIWRPCRPDLDNVIKAALDAAQLAGVLKDDGLVVELHAVKVWAAIGEKPSVILTFSEVE